MYRDVRGFAAVVTRNTDLQPQPLQEGRLGESTCTAVRERMGFTRAQAHQQADKGGWLSGGHLR